jgi:hypothetical protein
VFRRNDSFVIVEWMDCHNPGTGAEFTYLRPPVARRSPKAHESTPIACGAVTFSQHHQCADRIFVKVKSPALLEVRKRDSPDPSIIS